MEYPFNNNYSNNEIVYGTRWNDIITGGDSDQDFYLLGGGNDIINGGGGSDSLYINESFSEFDITIEYVDGEERTILESNTQTNSITTTSIENFYFNDIYENIAPVIISSSTNSIEENSSTDQIIYNVVVIDPMRMISSIPSLVQMLPMLRLMRIMVK